ncbi:Protein LITTLE ZIPPER 2 [Linum grandiflorum]
MSFLSHLYLTPMSHFLFSAPKPTLVQYTMSCSGRLSLGRHGEQPRVSLRLCRGRSSSVRWLVKQRKMEVKNMKLYMQNQTIILENQRLRIKALLLQRENHLLYIASLCS